MPSKKLKIQLLDDNSQGIADIPVKAAETELLSSPIGTTLFLLEEPQVSIKIGGQEVLALALDALPENLVFVRDGGGWKRQG